MDKLPIIILIILYKCILNTISIDLILIIALFIEKMLLKKKIRKK